MFRPTNATWPRSNSRGVTLARAAAIVLMLTIANAVHANSTTLASPASAAASIEVGTTYSSTICGVEAAGTFEGKSSTYDVLANAKQSASPLESGQQVRSIEINNSTPTAPLPPAAVTGTIMMAGNWVAGRMWKKRKI